MLLLLLLLPESTSQLRNIYVMANQERYADPDKMASMFTRPGYAAQDWVHLCTWDFFVGQWIYLQGLEKNVFTRLSLFATFNAGEAFPYDSWAQYF